MTKCWAHCLGGCKGKISGEHIITESLWEGDRICVQGLQWCRPAYKEIPVRSFTSNILCEGHNSELSNIGVDSGGADAFDVFRQASKVHEQRAANIEAGFRTGRFDVYGYTIKGPLLERWLLKTLINMEMSGDQGLTIAPYLESAEQPHCDLVEIVFGLRPFPGNSGLYIVADSARTIRLEERVRYVAFLRTIGDKTYVAAGEFLFYGFQFILSLEPEGLPDSVEVRDVHDRVIRSLKLLYRPHLLDFRINESSSQDIRVSW